MVNRGKVGFKLFIRLL